MFILNIGYNHAFFMTNEILFSRIYFKGLTFENNKLLEHEAIKQVIYYMIELEELLTSLDGILKVPRVLR